MPEINDRESSGGGGGVELATIAECNAGTNTEKAVTPRALAGSKHGTKYMVFEVFPDTTPLATGDGKKKMLIPADLAGYNIVSVEASLGGASSTAGSPTIQIARGRQPDATTTHSFEDVLSTRITIDVNEWYSGNATTAAVIDTTKDDILAGDIIRIDVDEAGTGAQGLFVVIGFRLP